MSRSEALLVRDQFIEEHTVARALDVIEKFRRAVRLPVVSRRSGQRPLVYSVVDGFQILEHLPEIQSLHSKTTRLVRELFGDAIEPLADRQVACNINITQPGGSYRYHYDRNAITAILYLNETGGGETECYPNYRVRVPAVAQYGVDRVVENPAVRWVFGHQVLVRPRTGRLLIMRGKDCLHSVREVEGDQDRINIVMSYDVRGARYANEERLNSYLYRPEPIDARDPNYA
ncbi:MAG TPA: 2OG-Fe(II) oxygenase [Pyrinomonadaceae bacterium]|nr:2OG-Fe(II) oxygenase [Pyrinomonadaceae bacterium]